jgi:hypothetical protein
MRLAEKNEKLREALREIANLHDVSADESMGIAQRALERD